MMFACEDFLLLSIGVLLLSVVYRVMATIDDLGFVLADVSYNLYGLYILVKTIQRSRR